MRELCFDMSIQQIHELYLYSTFDTQKSKLSVKEKLMSLVNQERKKASIELIVDWMTSNMEHIRVRTKVPVTSQRNRSLAEEKLNATGAVRVKASNLETVRLPTINPASSDKLKN